MIKKYCLLFFTLIISFVTQLSLAQQDGNSQKNINKIKKPLLSLDKSNFFGEIALKVANFKGDGTPILGLNVGYQLNNRLYGGIGYQTSLSNYQPSAEEDPDVFYKLTYGGVFIGYRCNPEKNIVISTPLFLGTGVNKLINEGEETINSTSNDKIIVIIPGVKSNFNINPRLSLNLGLNYRIIGKVAKERGLNSSDISGLEGVIGLKYHL